MISDILYAIAESEGLYAKDVFEQLSPTISEEDSEDMLDELTDLFRECF